MKYIVVLFLLNALSSFSQIWKEHFDTLSYYDRLERMSPKMGVKSYTLSDFDSSGNTYQYAYYEFDDNGFLVKECQGLSSAQKLDTSYYFYDNNGVFQEVVRPSGARLGITRTFVKDSFNRTIAFIKQINDSTFTTRYHYSKLGNLDSITYPTGSVVIYKYTSENKLSQKLIIDNGKMKEYFNYYHPNDRSLAYSDCHLITVWDEEIAACDSTIGTYGRNGKLSSIESYFYKDEAPHFTKFSYDRKGRATRVDYEERTGNAATLYYRNRKGLLMRIEHVDDKGKVYRYVDFEYELKRK